MARLVNEPIAVSVLLPVRNGAGTIMHAVQSMLQQDLSSLELIVVDDGSNDETSTLLEAVADPRLRLLRQKPQGIVAALNHGLSVVRAPYIARMDADDWSPPERLRLQATYLDAHPEVALVSSLVKHLGSPDQEGYAQHVSRINRLLTHEQMAQARFEDAPVAHPSVMLRTAVLQEAGGYQAGDLPEDYELWLRLLDQGYRFAKLPETLLHWADHPTRLSRTDSRCRQEAFYKIKACYFLQWYQQQASQPPVWVCGRGRQVRQRIRPFIAAGLELAGYIDLKPAGPGTPQPVIVYDEVVLSKQALVLSFVSDRKGKALIIRFFEQKGYIQGVNFWQMA